MEQATDIIRFMTAGCLVLIIARLLVSPYVTPRHAYPSVAFAACILSYLVIDWMSPPFAWYGYIFLIPAMTLSYFFWLFSRSLFDDSFRLRIWMIWGFVVIGGVQILLYELDRGVSGQISQLRMVLSQGISLLFVVLAIVAAARDKKSDLILERLQFRTVFIWLTASVILITVLTEISFATSVIPPWLDLLQKVVIAALTFYFAISGMQFKQGFYLNTRPTFPKPAALSDSDTALLEKINELFDSQDIWKTEGLTIRKLAEMTHEKEYKLRKAINQHLGFSNFNDFLNSYRIAYARDQLADPGRAEFTVLEIAYEAGYKSLSPFNKAFKQIVGMTPTQWRKSASGNPDGFQNP